MATISILSKSKSFYIEMVRGGLIKSYIIFRGNYDIVIGGNKVGEYCGTGSFGELALMYNTPRAATITATTKGTLWSLVSYTHYCLRYLFDDSSPLSS